MASNMKLTFVKLDVPKMDFARNPRNPSAYSVTDAKDMQQLIASIAEEGFRTDKPIVLSDRVKDGLWVVQGHRRLTAAREVNRLDNAKCREIPAIVYTGLSLDDERRMLIDQFLVRKLDEYEQYLAVKQLLLINGMSEDKIAQHVGMSRGWVQRRAWIAKFPPAVEQEWKKKVEEVEGYIPITDKVMRTLKAAWEEDRDAGLHHEEGGGPCFQTAWTGVVNRDPVPPTPKAMTRNDILEKAGIIRDKIIMQVMRYCAGDRIAIEEVQDQLQLLYAKAASWDALERSEGEQKQA